MLPDLSADVPMPLVTLSVLHAGDPKIRDLHLALPRQQNVARADVAVNDRRPLGATACVRVVQPAEHLRGDEKGQRDGERFVPRFESTQEPSESTPATSSSTRE